MSPSFYCKNEMDRFAGCVLFFVLHVYIIVNAADQAQRGKRTLEDCDCGITPDAANSYYDTPKVTEATVSGSKFPWMVAIRNKNNVQCSAAIITRSFVLTAGHCVHGDPIVNMHTCEAPLKEITPGRCLNLSDITIAFIYKDAVLRKFYAIRGVVVHPDYQIVEGRNGEYTKNDIALIHMTGAVACTDYRKPVCLPFHQNFDTPGRRAVIAGWGATETPGPTNARGGAERQKLTTGVLTVQPHDKCFETLNHEKNVSSICAKGSVSACKGDSGAPLITDYDGRFYIFGVTSHLTTTECDAEHPQLFANVKTHLKWIMDIVKCCP